MPPQCRGPIDSCIEQSGKAGWGWLVGVGRMCCVGGGCIFWGWLVGGGKHQYAPIMEIENYLANRLRESVSHLEIKKRMKTSRKEKEGKTGRKKI